ncbi:hypothetical protein BJY16_005672 [Actinoplanes octamycinicus]|uniref:Uncharacterized protein n=1 Tax=Actinoplanes octamycinicus TaxID=135948 RepID=A0A7W7H1F5_9ACTN|nr:hypothetical protein [Actinoplanes octamycinicus]MBB4742213.1 hypothetical protein [Actinoplanes octamycinicus]
MIADLVKTVRAGQIDPAGTGPVAAVHWDRGPAARCAVTASHCS